MVISLFCVGSFAYAQQPSAADFSKIPPPQAPYVIPIPDKAQWTVTLNYEADKKKEASATNAADAASQSESAKPDAGRLAQIRSVKVGTTKRDVYVYADGRSKEWWYYNGDILKLDSAGRRAIVMDAAALRMAAEKDPNASAAMLRRGNLTQSFGFTGLNWVDISTYDKVTLFEKQAAYHYVLKDPEANNAVIAEAWINAKTNYPMAYRADGVQYVFAFDAPPSSLSLSPLFAQAVERRKRMQDQMKALEKDAGLR